MREIVLADITDSKGINAQAPSIKDIKTSVDHVSDQLGAMVNAQAARELNRIMKRFSTIDYGLLYRQASQKYCEKTCCWVLDNLLFKTWLQSTPTSLWLSGLVDSGKTMLTTFVIQQLQQNRIFAGNILLPDAVFLTKERSTWTKARLAYFYCDANTSETLGTEAVLGSILA